MSDHPEQTKQTNETKPATGRPAEVGEDAVIAAGRAISARGDTVTATGLRREIGSGRPQRLKHLWDAHVETEAARAHKRAALPAHIRDSVAKEVQTLASKLEEIVAAAHEKAVHDAEDALAGQRAELAHRENLARAEVEDAYRLVEEADARAHGLQGHIEQLEGVHQKERAARLEAEKDAAETRGLVAELRSQLAARKAENDDLRAVLGELRAFKERVQKQSRNAQHKANTAPTTQKTGTGSGKPGASRNS
jgi:chromosome segregation ATPase